MKLAFVAPRLPELDGVEAEALACTVWQDARPTGGVASLCDWRPGGGLRAALPGGAPGARRPPRQLDADRGSRRAPAHRTAHDRRAPPRAPVLLIWPSTAAPRAFTMRDHGRWGADLQVQRGAAAARVAD